MTTGEKTTWTDAQRRGFIAGAIHRGEAWPVGTKVRMAGKNSKVDYYVTGVRGNGAWADGRYGWAVELTPIGGTRPGVSTFWTSIEYLRKV